MTGEAVQAGASPAPGGSGRCLPLARSSPRAAAVLDLERLDRDTYRALPGGRSGPRLFGGLVAGQALRAAASNVEADHLVHSMRAYFLRAGRPRAAITYEVDRLRDGRSFTTRRVVARQDGEAILNLDASFHRPEPGGDHAPTSPMPDVAPPEEGEEVPRPPWAGQRPVEMRRARATGGRRMVWFRALEPMPEDPHAHACLVAFAADMGPVGVVVSALGHGPGFGPSRRVMAVSLDHCLWFHRPVRADDWLLYDLEAVAAAHGRGLARGAIWARDGELAVTLTQEVLVRRRTEP